MRVVVTGATGNVGTSVLDALGADPSVESIVGVARRVPSGPPPAGRRWDKVEWVAADVVGHDLRTVFAGADAVVHLAWLIQPSHRIHVMRATNVDGSERVFAAAAAAGVASVVYASSVGAYSRGPKDRPVDETWPTGGTQSSLYGRHKAAVERALDRFESAHPAVRVVRLRPGLIFKRESASDIRRLFLGARPLPVPRAALRLGADVSWRLRLQPTPPGWVDLAFDVPVLDTTRARRVLGWAPHWSAGDALLDLLGGFADTAGGPTPALAR